MAGGILALRDRLQDYGRGIPDPELGAALLGLLWTFPFPRQQLTLRGRMSLVGWRLAPFGAGIDAAAAAAAWHALVRDTSSRDAPTRHGIAVELVDGPRPSRNEDERAWVLDLLGRTPGVAAVHLATAQRSPPVAWTWPAQLALFDDAASRKLRAKLSATPGPGAAHERGPHDLVIPISAAQAPRPIELLVLGDTLAGALSRVRSRARLPRIHTALVLGGIGRTPQPVKTAETLRRKARADAVCVVQVPERREVDFLDAVLAGLAHDLDLDVALAVAAREHRLAPPLLVAAEDAFTHAHWTARARMLDPSGPSAGSEAGEPSLGVSRGASAPGPDAGTLPPASEPAVEAVPEAGAQRPRGPGGASGGGARPPQQKGRGGRGEAGRRGHEDRGEAGQRGHEDRGEAGRRGHEDRGEAGQRGHEDRGEAGQRGHEDRGEAGQRGHEDHGRGTGARSGTARRNPRQGAGDRGRAIDAPNEETVRAGRPPDARTAEHAPLLESLVPSRVDSIVPIQAQPRPPQAQPQPREPAPRYLQAELFAGAPPEKVTTAPLVVGPHRLDVWIGPRHEGALIAPARVPEEELPPSADGHRLTVVLAAPVLGEPQVASLWLPPDGASERVRFAFMVPAGTARLEARISLLHDNRVLQTVVLVADVATGEPVALSLALEGVVRRNLDGIAGRARFDAALIANRMSDKRLVSVIAGDRASLVPTGTSIDRLVGEVSQLLAAATNNPARYGAPDSEGTTELLADLARKGYLLREALLDMPQVRAELERAARIQIVIARPDETTLPLEICYDGVAPGVGATMCPAWRAALEAGTCQPACPADRATVVCPVAFWGTHRVIERHAYAKIDAALLAGNAYGLQQEPAVGRARLPIVGGSVCAAADAARAVDAAAVDRAFAEAGEVAGPSSEAKTWSQWRALIHQNPSILVLLAHSDLVKTNRALVIGADDTAMISDINPALVGAGGGSGPIVLLLGCSTAIAETAFQSFVAQFRAAGAAIVIGTLCEILGQHAAPIAGQLLAEIQRAHGGREPTPLGDLMPVLRRRLLARGYPIAMAVASYGDADWQI